MFLVTYPVTQTTQIKHLFSKVNFKIFFSIIFSNACFICDTLSIQIKLTIEETMGSLG